MEYTIKPNKRMLCNNVTHVYAILALFAILAWTHSSCNRGGTMGTKLRSWWQEIRKYWVAIGVVAIVLVVVIALIIAGYRFDWTGFNGNNKSG